MAEFTFKTGTPPPSDATGLQLLFKWTRTQVLSAETIGVDENDERIGPMQTTEPDSVHVVIDWIVGPAGVPGQGDTPLEVRVRYVGEPLQLLGWSWLTPAEALFDLADAIDDWLACRESRATSSKAHRLFLEMDRETDFVFMRHLDRLTRDARAACVKQIGTELGHRVRQRASGMKITKLTASPCLAMVADVLKDTIEKAFPNDRAGVEVAFDAFAAGRLQESCASNDPRLLAVSACDPDSANIMLFGELVLVLLDHRTVDDEWRRRAEYWHPLLNCFARIQELFLSRWVGPRDPKCFKRYDGTAAAISPQQVAKVRTRYRNDFGDDEDKLAARMACTLTHVAQGTYCFGDHHPHPKPDDCSGL